MKEIWKTIPEWEDYEVSNFGMIRSLKCKTIKQLKTAINSSGYSLVHFYKKGKSKTFQVHQIVALVFLNHKPEGMKLVIDHIDSNKQNNRIENLRIVTVRENCSKEKTIKSGLPVGVSYYKRDKNYRSFIGISGKKKFLGYFKTQEQASQAYQEALSELN